MPSLSEYWQSGFRGLHIEECISNAFADFAPYAAADQQRIVVSRQTPAPGRPIGRSSCGCDSRGTAAVNTFVGTPIGPASHIASSSSVIVEESGDFTVQMRDPHAGSMTFSTTGHMQMEAAVRIAMPVWSSASRQTDSSTSAERAAACVSALSVGPPVIGPASGAAEQRRAEGAIEEAANAAAIPSAVAATHPDMKPASSQLRFTDFTRPLTISASGAASTGTTTASAPASWGQLELDFSLPNWSANRQSIGARAGPAALRVNRTLSSETSTAAKSPMNSGSLSDDDLLASNGGSGDGTGRWYQYIVDAAVCVPFGGSSSSAGAPRVARRALDGTPVVMLPSAPWALTCGMQIPLSTGDTLVGISLQNDRASSVTMPLPGVEWVTAAPAGAPSAASPSPSPVNPLAPTAGEALHTACVPSLLYPSHRADRSSGSDDAFSSAGTAATPLYVAIPSITVRLLLVQTLASHTLVRRGAANLSASQLDMGSGYDSSTSASRIASSYDWRQLPTLAGISVGFNRDQLRVSAASILHNGEVDLEAAAVLDLTPWMPSMPTMLRLGYNNAGRLAVGITSLFYETVTATLGVHVARGEEAKFGIEVSF
ncbi:hypothetical protein LSCM1_02942 [Leishmania martiniquensis]|uniref:Uncharacterized protein n=1 Tax=Leishmania martiniquensis TaxID=1580590 RepID=A0A836GU36_9TRYP|nr:hypothetical protein LSCM1_02942 [Leishmania martiniquensis]